MSRHLHILYLGSLPPHPGGSAVSAQLLLRGFAARGCRVQAVGAISAEALKSGDEFARNFPEIEAVRYEVERFYQNGMMPASEAFIQLETALLAQVLPPLLARRPDVVLLGREYMALHAMPIFKAAGARVVVRAAGAGTAGLVFRTYPAERVQQTVAQLSRAERIVAVADYQAGWLRELGLTNVQVILNAVDTGLFRPMQKDRALQARLGIADNQTVVLYAGNLNSRKRPLDLAQAAALALQRCDDLVFVVAGTGSLLEEMQATCRQLGLEAHFRFTGWVEYREMPAYFNLADIVVLTSESEGLSRVYLETQASGRLLLASDIPAAQEVVEDGQTGLLFRLGDVKDLAAKMVQAAGDPKLRQTIGERARERVGRYAIETAVGNYLTLFESLANGSK